MRETPASGKHRDVTWSRKNLEGVETIAPTSSVYLTPERQEIRRTARAFAMEEVLPLADELDPQRGEIPDALLERLAELGYFGIMVDREHGGLGLGVFEYCLICEELARGWMSVASIIARGNGTGCASPDDDRRADLLRRSAAGRWIGGIAFSEPSAGSDLANVECSAERDGDQFVITGTKRWVGHAERADFLHLLSRTRPPRDGEGRSDGLELFLVEKERGSFPEARLRHPDRQDRVLRAHHLGAALRRPAGPGRRAAGHRAGRGPGVQGQPALARAGAGADGGTGGRARAGALEDAVAYSRQRVQFGHPIGDQQVIRHAIADMAAQVEAARQLWMHAAWLVDSGEAADVATSQAKLVASETAEQVTSQALQIFGGNGYTTEYSVERYWRDARLTKIFEGTSEIQRKIVSDALVGH